MGGSFYGSGYECGLCLCVSRMRVRSHPYSVLCSAKGQSLMDTGAWKWMQAATALISAVALWSNWLVYVTAFGLFVLVGLVAVQLGTRK